MHILLHERIDVIGCWSGEWVYEAIIIMHFRPKTHIRSRPKKTRLSAPYGRQFG